LHKICLLSATKKAIYITLQRMSSRRLSLVLLLLASCATAADDNDGQAPAPDARKGVTFPDAGPQADAAPTPDAAPPLPVDAATPAIDAGGTSGICETNADCTVSGECCFVIACTPGTKLGDACLPD
jgi:hypothetical protein